MWFLEPFSSKKIIKAFNLKYKTNLDTEPQTTLNLKL